MGFDKPLAKRILGLALPVVLAMVSQTAVNLLDTIMVGRLPAEYSIAGQAAIGHSIIYLWAVGGFLSALGVGTQAIAGRRYGEGRWDKTGQVLTNSLLLTTVTGAVFSVVAFLITPWVFPFFNSNPDVIREGVPYCQARMVSVLSMVATVSFKHFYDGIGRTRVHMTAALIMNGANALLNYVLIFGVWGFPQLYVTGAGVASAIASYMGLFFMLAWSLRRGDRARYQYFRWSNLSSRVCWQITRLSVPSGLATVAVMSGFALFLKIVGELDVLEAANAAAHATTTIASDGTILLARPAIYSAAAKVIIDIMSISFMSCIAFGTATATLVSQNLGARKPDMAARFGWESVKIGVSAMAVIGAVAILFPDAVLSIFSKDLEVIDAARSSLRLMGATEVFIAVGLILAQALFGAGNTKYVMWVELILHFTCLVPLAWLFGVVLEGGLFGVWSAAATYILLMATLMAWKFREGKWKLIKL